MSREIEIHSATSASLVALLKARPEILRQVLDNAEQALAAWRADARDGGVDLATGQPLPAEEAGARPRAERAAAVLAVPEEEVQAAAVEQPPTPPAPAALQVFNFASTSRSNDVVTLDASMSGSVDLGMGRDGVALPGNKADYSVARQGNGWTVSHEVDNARVTISLKGVEWLQFDDGVVSLDMGGSHAVIGDGIVKAVTGAPRSLNRIFSVAEDLDRGQSHDNIIGDLMNLMTRERTLPNFTLGPEVASAGMREVGQGAPLESIA